MEGGIPHGWAEEAANPEENTQDGLSTEGRFQSQLTISDFKYMYNLFMGKAGRQRERELSFGDLLLKYP